MRNSQSNQTAAPGIESNRSEAKRSELMQRTGRATVAQTSDSRENQVKACVTRRRDASLRDRNNFEKKKEKPEAFVHMRNGRGFRKRAPAIVIVFAGTISQESKPQPKYPHLAY